MGNQFMSAGTINASSSTSVPAMTQANASGLSSTGESTPQTAAAAGPDDQTQDFHAAMISLQQKQNDLLFGIHARSKMAVIL